jgi:D-amino-acid dehydrogenase
LVVGNKGYVIYMSSSKHVLIVGGGIVGLSVAYYAQRKGYKITVLERGAPDHDMASLGNAGMIVPSHFVPLAAPGMVGLGLRMMWNPESPFYIKPRLDRSLIDWGIKFMRAANPDHVAKAGPVFRNLGFASRQCYLDWASELANVFGLEQRGLLEMSKTEQGVHEGKETVEKAHHLGIPSEWLDASQVAKLEPNVKLDIAGAVYYPMDCHLTPPRLMAGLAQHLLANGAEIRWNTDVTGWQLDTAGHIETVKTAQGNISADEYVIAGGAWSPMMAQGLRVNLPMQAGKGYSLTLYKPKLLPNICALFTEARMAMTPMSGSLRFGGTMEIAGTDTRINPARIRGIIKSVPKYMPDYSAADFVNIEPWVGLRPCSPDGLPYVGRSKHHANLSIATGHAMLGISLGPITGKLITQLLSGEPPEIEMGMLDVDRYNG